MKRILVATDGSDGSDRAIDYAARWAQRVDAELLIVNVIGGYGLPDRLMRAFTQAQQAWLQQMLEAASGEMLTKARERARAAGAATILLESRSGDVAASIIGMARDKSADIIVVGKRGAGHIAELLLGSVSQKLVSLAPFRWLSFLEMTRCLPCLLACPIPENAVAVLGSGV